MYIVLMTHYVNSDVLGIGREPGPDPAVFRLTGDQEHLVWWRTMSEVAAALPEIRLQFPNWRPTIVKSHDWAKDLKRSLDLAAKRQALHLAVGRIRQKLISSSPS